MSRSAAINLANSIEMIGNGTHLAVGRGSQMPSRPTWDMVLPFAAADRPPRPLNSDVGKHSSFMSDIQNFALTILSSVGVSVAFSGTVIWLARTWISERLQSSIKHEYDQRLAALNAELRSRGDAHAAMLKAEIDKESDKLRIASSSFTEVQKASIARKLDAIDTLWSGILATRETVPPVMSFLDILTVDEYVAAKDNPFFKELIGKLDHEKVMRVAIDAKGSLERVRPYVGEYVWALFATFQAVILRTVFLIHLSKTDAEKLNWHQDRGIRQLLQSALGPEGLREFDATRIGKVAWFQSQFERRVLEAMDKLITGKEFGDAALRQAEVMEQQIRLAKQAVAGG